MNATILLEKSRHFKMSTCGICNLKYFNTKEFAHRESTAPYFARKGGLTSPTGYQWTSLPVDWRPDLVNSESRIVFALLFRL
jgi:hypothetical protein